MAVRKNGQSEGEGALPVKCRRGGRWRFAVVFGGLVVTAFAGWLAWCKFTEPPEPSLAGMRASKVFPLWMRPLGMYPAQKDVVITAEAMPWMMDHVLRGDPAGAEFVGRVSERLPRWAGDWVPRRVTQLHRRYVFASVVFPESIRAGRLSWTNLSAESTGLIRQYPVDAAGFPLVMMATLSWPDAEYRAAGRQLLGLLEAPDPRTRFTVAKVALEYANQLWPDSEDRPRGDADRAEIRRVLATVSGWDPREWSLTEAYVMCVVVARNRRLVLPGQFEPFLGRVESGGLEARALADLTRQVLASEAGVPEWVRRTIDRGNSMATHLAVRFLHDVGKGVPGDEAGAKGLAEQWARVLASPPSTGSWRAHSGIEEGRLSVKSFSVVAESMDSDPDRIVLLSQVLESLAWMGPLAKPAREEIGRYRIDTRKEVADMAEAAWNRLEKRFKFEDSSLKRRDGNGGVKKLVPE